MLYRIGMVMEQVDMVFVGGLNTLCKILAHVFAMGGTHLVAYILLTELLGGGGNHHGAHIHACGGFTLQGSAHTPLALHKKLHTMDPGLLQ